MTNDFRAPASLVHAVRSALGDDVKIRISLDEYLGIATVGIILQHDDWDARMTVLSKTDRLRDMLIQDWVLDFVFEDRGDDIQGTAQGVPAEHPSDVFV